VDLLRKAPRRKSRHMCLTSLRTMRTSTVLSCLLFKTILVHSGAKYLKLKLKRTMLGHKIGEFIYTKKRSISIHSKLLLKLKAKRVKKARKKNL